jgi:multidrug efflux pump subunit AcrA (membrane-fusion protein)
MKNALIAILSIMAIVAGYVAATSRLRLSMEGLEGKTETVRRGDLTLPVSATGVVKPARRVILKSEASGEVLEIPRQPGERIKSGELLIRLQRDDEQRTVNRAKLDVDVARAKLEEARINLELFKGSEIDAAKSSLSQIDATLPLHKFRAERVKEDAGAYHEEERLERITNYETQLARREGAVAALEKARLNIPRAEQLVAQTQATCESAQNTLADAEKRLAKTDIVAPIDGVLADVLVQIGEVIQGGKTTLTGGTALGVVLDTHKLILQAEVDEADIGRVLELSPDWARPGHEGALRMPDSYTEAAAQIPHLPKIHVETFGDSEEFTGLIERIYPEPKSVNNVVTYLVDVVIISENKDKLLPGMRAEVTFTSEHRKDVVLCPNEAIRRGPTGQLGVLIPMKGAPAHERATEFVPCKIGLTDGTHSEILEGLEEGAVVYTRPPAKKTGDDDASKRRG